MLYERGAHVKGYNSSSIGICLSGGVKELAGEEGAKNTRQLQFDLILTRPELFVPENNFDNRQFITMIEYLKELRMFYPKAEVKGHGSFPGVNKACPCFDVNAKLREFGFQTEVEV